ncbi:uncharacterized protein LOC117115008 [Anneissia japonica]|uniref:uncharacterized protein LOC117115008 n=1 Tax=Anneissia japonica TaxID=1529436 RepID=UPI001425B07C|nr:uncharacterized protein LOC117115008 [Anneissia japonica]
MMSGQPETNVNVESDEENPDDSQNDNVSQFYVLDETFRRENKTFNARETDRQITFRNLDGRDMFSIVGIICQIFDVLNNVCDGVAQNDMVCFILRSPDLDNPISIPFGRQDHITEEVIVWAIEDVLQSHLDILVNDQLILNVLHVRMPIGGGKKPILFPDALIQKRCVIDIKNVDDKMCCARAIVTGVSCHEDKLDNKIKWDNIRRGHRLQDDLARQLHESSNEPIGPCGVAEIKLFQIALPEYQIVVFTNDVMKPFIFQGPPKDKKIYLLLHENHFNFVTSIKAFFNNCNFCEDCLSCYDNRDKHSCKYTCSLCHSSGCSPLFRKKFLLTAQIVIKILKTNNVFKTINLNLKTNKVFLAVSVSP